MDEAIDLEHVVASTGARDLFVLRRISEDRFFNVGGVGRGDGWAGNISVEPASEPWLTSVLSDGVASRRSGIPFRAFGPYWSTEVVGVNADDAIIVLAGEGVSELPFEVLNDVGKRVAASACEVLIEKQEADKMELEQAVEAIRSIDATTSEAAALQVVRTAANALSCEFGALLLYGPPIRVFVADEGWRPAATDEEIIAAIYPLAGLAADGPFTEQDLSTSPYALPPLSYGDGLVARCTVGVGPDNSMGLVVVAHAGTSPRGFTSLCRQVAAAIGENAGPVLGG